MFVRQSRRKGGRAVAWLRCAGARLLGTPLCLCFGGLSGRIGRKKVILAGCRSAACAYFPIFEGFTHCGNPAIEEAVETSPAVVVAEPKTSSFQFDPAGVRKFTSSCDVATAALTRAGVPYSVTPAPVGSLAEVRVGSNSIASYEAEGLAGDALKTQQGEFTASLRGVLNEAGYPEKADTARINVPMTILLLWLLVIFVTMVYGPIAAYLVELFPTRIRYTSMSLPYHIGNGWFGGFLPAISFALVAGTGNIYYGLWYPIGIALMALVIGTIFLRETKDVDITK